MNNEMRNLIIELREGGTPWPELMDQVEAALGEKPNYSQCWLTWEAHRLPEAQKLEPTGKAVVKARHQDDDSWGMIAVRTNLPESRVRKLYAENCGKRSEGQRKGMGGRWLKDDQRYYQDEASTVGHQFSNEKPIPEPSSINGISEDATMKELRAVAKQRGLKVPKGIKKAGLIDLLS